MSEAKKTDSVGMDKLIRAVVGGVDYEYRSLVDTVLRSGRDVITRGHKCRRLINFPVVFTSTPLVSLRKTAWRTCLREWEWFMSGSNAIEDLHPSVRPWWEPWATKRGKGNGPLVKTRVEYNYSQQFREFNGTNNHGEQASFDQIQYLIEGICNHPYSRRNLITTWNTADMARDDCPITNCHGSLIQAFVDPQSNKLTLFTVQRSADVICGVPHNWLQYWGFLLWLAHITGRDVGELHWVGTDCHIYYQHMELAEKIRNLAVDPITTPELRHMINPSDLFNQPFKADDFQLHGDYFPILTDKAELVV